MLPPSSPYSALLIDLDGTLLAGNAVSRRVALAVARVARLLPVSIAAGRRVADTASFARQLGLTAPQICDGGGTILTRPPAGSSGLVPCPKPAPASSSPSPPPRG